MSARRGSLSDTLVSSLGALTACRPGARRGTSGSLTPLPNGTRTSTLKRHSLAGVELASWTARGTGRRGSAFTLPFISSSSSLSAGEAVRKAKSLEGVQTAIIKLFQRKPLGEHELGSLQETIRAVSEAEAGSLIYEYYKDQLLKKGMVILREKIKNEQGAELLAMLGETWDYFFREIVPTLQALMYPVAAVMRGIDVRNTTLLEFRNIVVLKVGLKEAVESKKYQVPANIRQMLLVLQGLNDPTFLSKEQLDLEKMAACVIVPFLGTRGLYQGAPEPVTRATFRPPPVLAVPNPDITITVYEDSPVGAATRHHHYHPHAISAMTSPHLQRLEQQHHPIASPAAMRKRHPRPPSSPLPLAAPPSPQEGSTTMPRLTTVMEVAQDVPMVSRRHSIVGT